MWEVAKYASTLESFSELFLEDVTYIETKPDIAEVVLLLYYYNRGTIQNKYVSTMLVNSNFQLCLHIFLAAVPDHIE